MSPRMCRLCGLVEDQFDRLNPNSECWVEVNCRVLALERKVGTLQARAEKAEAKLRRITPYANHTQLCAITNWTDGDPVSRHVCDCGLVEAVRS